MQSRVVARPSELRAFLRDEVDEVYRYALALTASAPRAEALTFEAALDLAHHVEAVAAAPVSTRRLMLAIRGKVLRERPRRRGRLGGLRRDARRTRPDGTTAARRSQASSGERAGPLDALARLDPDERVALVLRHHDGMLLSDIAELFGLTIAGAAGLVERAEAAVLPQSVAVDERPTPAAPPPVADDPVAELIRSLPGGPTGLVDRVWDAVDATLVPAYTRGADGRVESPTSETHASWLQPSDPAGRAVPPPAGPGRRGPKGVATVLLVGAVVVATIFGVAALTAPKGAEHPASTISAPTAEAAAPVTRSVGAKGAGTSPLTLPEGVPDVVVDLTGVDPHPPDQIVPLRLGTTTVPTDRATRISEPDLTTVVRAGVSTISVHRPDGPNGRPEAWLVFVKGPVRTPTSTGSPQAWSVRGGGVVLALTVAGPTDMLALVGLRPGGGGTWLRPVAGAHAEYAVSDGSIVCALPSTWTAGVLSYASYRVLT